MPNQFTLVTGGIKSGKSSFAEKLASQLGNDVIYIATALVGDQEMERKVQIHRNRRPADWHTIEEPYNIKEALQEYGSKHKVILIDCLTMLISNHIFREEGHECTDVSEATINKIIQEMKLASLAAKSAECHVIVVTNEVGFSLVSENRLGRKFQELVGKVNQLFAHAADSVYLLVSGCPVKVKGGNT